MSALHTPGPWRTAPPSVGRFKVITVDGGKVVGEASNYCLDANANLRLIAAAPELLEALRECSARLSACRLIIEDDDARHMAAESVSKARAAIAKATGATP